MPVAQRARAYLDVNCAHCHNREGAASNSGLYLGLEESDPTAIGLFKRPVAAGRGRGGFEFVIEPGCVGFERRPRDTRLVVWVIAFDEFDQSSEVLWDSISTNGSTGTFENE